MSHSPKTNSSPIHRTQIEELKTRDDNIPCSGRALNELQYRSFIENLPVLFYAVQPQPPFAPIYVSPAFARFGYPLEDWIGDPQMWIRAIHKDDREWVFSETCVSTVTDKEVDYEYRIVDARGDIHWVRDRGCLIRNAAGDVVCREGVILDITDRKNAEQELKMGEERFRNLFENAHDIIYIHDLDGNYLSINKAGERVFGYSREEALQMNMSQISVSEHYGLVRHKLEQKIRGDVKQTVYEVDCRRKDGTRVTLEVNSTLILKNGVAAAVQGIARDITERKQAEERLRQSEELNRLIVTSSIDCIKTLDLEGNLLSMSEGGQIILCIKNIDDFLNKPLFEFWKEDDDREAAKAAVASAASGKTGRFVGYFPTLDGETKWWDVQISPILDPDGRPTRLLAVSRDVTERKLADIAVRENEEKYRDLFENANDLIYTHDLNGNFTSLNRAGELISGYSREEAFKMNISEVVAPELLQSALQRTESKLVGEAPTAFELDIISKYGNRVSLELSTRLIRQNGKPVGVQGVGRDITERKRTEQALKNSEMQYRQLGEGILHLVWTAVPDGSLDYVNQRTLDFFNRSFDQMIGEGWTDVVHPDDLGECLRRWSHSTRTGAPYEMEFRLRRHDGLYRWHTARAMAGRDAAGVITKWFGTTTDIHEQKESEEKLSYYARHDPLTDLPNRIEFMTHLRQAISRAADNKSASFAVLFLDLDRFKVVNDSLGHVIGDKLLIAIAERLQSCLRPGDIVARLGGDEITILLIRTGGPAEVASVAERLQAKISAPFNLDSYEVFTTASIGIILSDITERDPEDFLREADAAMYRAKASGKARYEIFDREMHVKNLNLLKVETDLRHAVERNEFEVFYQPIVELKTGSVREFEALIRWNHPINGMTAPNDFIGVAEETGLILPIGLWVMEESCRQIAEWQKEFTFPLSISVNLSARQLLSPSLIRDVKEIIEHNCLKPRQLRLEVTESTVMDHREKSLAVLTELNDFGIMLSTDDFGTGYSSLSYLQQFPFNRLKIDRSFIEKMDCNMKSESIVKTILMLGVNLGIEVVAEGIETEEQCEMLTRFGCRKGQGYLLSKPLNAKLTGEFLREATLRFDAERTARSLALVNLADDHPELRVN